MSSVRRLVRFIKPYWQWALLAPLLMTLEVVMDLMQPLMVERIVDEGIANMDLTLVVRMGLLMIGLALIGSVGGITNGVFAAKASQGFAADLRDALFRKVQTFSFGNLDTFGTIASFVSYARRFTRPLNQVAQLYTTIQSALAGAERVFDLLDEEPELADAPDAKSLEHIEGKVTLRFA